MTIEILSAAAKLSLSVVIALSIVAIFLMPYKAHCKELQGQWIDGGCMRNGESVAF